MEERRGRRKGRDGGAQGAIPRGGPVVTGEVITMPAAQWVRRFVLMSTLFLLPACTITTRVQPIPRDTVKAVCIKENPAVWSKGFLPVLRAQFEGHGIVASVYTEDVPADCRHRVEYEANWYWDVAVYLQYADVRIFDGDRLIGRATYDARDAGARLDKFGPTARKLERIMTRLLTGPSAGEP